MNRSLFMGLWLILVSLASHAQLDRSLVASYYFSGNADDTVHHYKSRVKGARLTMDRFGNPYAAYSFDGVDDYISLGTNTDLRQRIMSISMWVKIYDFESNNRNHPAIPFISARVRHDVEYYEAIMVGVERQNHKFSGGCSSLMREASGVVSREKMELDTWYHLVFTFDLDTIQLYVNGKLSKKNYKSFVTTYLVTDSLMLGYVGNRMPEDFKYRNYSWFNGCIDDVKLYNRVLTNDEITELYNEPDPQLPGRPDGNLRISLMEVLRRYWPILTGIALAIVLSFLIVRWRINYLRKKEKQGVELQQKIAQLEMKALRSQMNPHFIFNAINSIQHYVLTNEKELANKYLVKFSQLMRNILDLSKQELISLKDELETVQLYVEIEALRFNNAFSFELSIAPDVFLENVRLPPLLIQPFVENAIWHGLLLKEGNKKLSITVSQKANNLVIEIDDNGIGREAAQKFSDKELKRRSFGMAITQDRLTVLNKVFGIFISFYLSDKKDEKGEPLGTTVFINIKL